MIAFVAHLFRILYTHLIVKQYTYMNTYVHTANTHTQSAVDTITIAFRPFGPHQYSAHVHMYTIIKL